MQALERLRRTALAPNLVVEVHETAVMEVQRMRELAARLREIGVRFAYDDFGAGQARLNELGEVPAHFVKFDMGLIRGIHEASERKKRVVSDLVRLVLTWARCRWPKASSSKPRPRSAARWASS
jgi:EAL domain-containing protein (putative c-di-GMP-specific phosphodiesterase class I)